MTLNIPLKFSSIFCWQDSLVVTVLFEQGPLSSMWAWRREKGDDVGVRFAHPNLCGLQK
jgi:hypothetical protein